MMRVKSSFVILSIAWVGVACGQERAPVAACEAVPPLLTSPELCGVGHVTVEALKQEFWLVGNGLATDPSSSVTNVVWSDCRPKLCAECLSACDCKLIKSSFHGREFEIGNRTFPQIVSEEHQPQHCPALGDWAWVKVDFDLVRCIDGQCVGLPAEQTRGFSSD